MNQVSELSQTINFPNAACKVFSKLARTVGPGLMVLWGGSP